MEHPGLAQRASLDIPLRIWVVRFSSHGVQVRRVGEKNGKTLVWQVAARY